MKIIHLTIINKVKGKQGKIKYNFIIYRNLLK